MSLAAIRADLPGIGTPPAVGARGPDAAGAWSVPHAPARAHPAVRPGLPLAERILAWLTETAGSPHAGGGDRGRTVYRDLARRTVAVEGPVRPLDLLV